MFEIIKEIIVKWDPIDLMGFAPPDEYDDECRLILDKYTKTQESLDKIIYNIFSNKFGDTFQNDLATCQKVAKEIESKISKRGEVR